MTTNEQPTRTLRGLLVLAGIWPPAHRDSSVPVDSPSRASHQRYVELDMLELNGRDCAVCCPGKRAAR